MSQTFETSACRLLGIRFPLLQAPMAGGWTTPALVAAVSNAGGYGQLAAAGLSRAQLLQQIVQTLELTGAPFGVNFLIAPPEAPARAGAALTAALGSARQALGLGKPAAAAAPASAAELLEAALEAGLRWFSFALGDPAPFVPQMRKGGARWIAMVTTVEEALRAEAGGASLIVAQGAEAGGHRSTFDLPAGRELPLIGTLALVPQIVDAVHVPVIAAGGIMDGRGLVAALALGASGAQLGTRFLLANEANVFPGFRQRLLDAIETDTTITRVVSGRPCRALRNRLVETLSAPGVELLPWPHQRVASADIHQAAIRTNSPDWAPMLAGQNLRSARTEQPAGEIVAEIEREARAVVAGWA
ncbi:MAG TPA: nitronate monooxygenase [Candidatus Binatia bacterium]|nr:nitronate monooxygenase [Candidatus Binatia bacterium]